MQKSRQLVRPVRSRAGASTATKQSVILEPRFGLLECVGIVLCVMIGTGIFVSPKGIVKEVKSVGSALVVWLISGILATFGALCYAELGAAIPLSGGDYAYILEAYGRLMGFLYLWDSLVLFVPTINAILALVTATYTLQPFFSGDCKCPEFALQLIAAVYLSFLTFMNCRFLEATSKMQNVIMIAKVASVLVIIVAGVVYMCLGHLEHFDKPFENTNLEPGHVALAFYAGIYSFAGFNYLNFVTEELKNPYRNLPYAIFIALPLVTVIYVLANMGFFAVLTVDECIGSDAIGITFGQRIIGKYSVIIPILVALSAFGGLSAHIMAAGRVFFAGARDGLMPTFLGHINVKYLTPMPALIILCILSILMVLVGDVYVLIILATIVEISFITLSVSSVIYFRFKSPNMPRPIKIPLIIPIIFVLICIFLIAVPAYVSPWEVGTAVGITILGIPVYYLCVIWQTKPMCFIRGMNRFT